MDDGGGDDAELVAMSQRRASDDDRDTAVARIRSAAGSGLLSLEEVEQRLGIAYGAKTIGELVPLVADLPTRTMPPTVAQRAARHAAFRNAAFRSHFTIYVLTIGFLIGIWGLSGGGFFWPFFPAAGWGIGMGAHFASATASQTKREARLKARSGVSTPRDPKALLDGTSDAASVQRLAATAERGLPRSTEPVRRFVVAMFIDVVGSTAMNERLGDDGWVRVRDAFRRLASTCFEEAGGYEVSSAGDGVFARFTTPNDAAAAALALRDALARQRAETGFAPETRMGIHSGEAMETEGGEDLIGAVINLAARVMGAAEPGEILVTEHVADHLDGRFTTAGRGLHELRGVARPRHLLAIDRVD